MRNIVILLFICLGFGKARAQTFHSYADTANYLIHQIENKKSLYVGKPLSVLLDSVQVNPAYVIGQTGMSKSDFGKSIIVFFNYAKAFNKEHFMVIDFDTVPPYQQLFPVFFPAAGGSGNLQSVMAVYQTLIVKDIWVKDYTNDDPINPDVHY